jgi:hypothetical protein
MYQKDFEIMEESITVMNKNTASYVLEISSISRDPEKRDKVLLTDLFIYGNDVYSDP